MVQVPPLFTSLVMAICLLVFVLQSFHIGTGLSSTCLKPSALVSQFQLYRIFSAPFCHAGLLHIFFNLLALYFLGVDFERQVGTLAACYTVLIVIIPLSGIVHVGLAYAADAIGSLHLRFDCSVGYSGVLFALIVVAIASSGASSVSFLGMFSLSARIYPWFLLVILSLLSPSLSFLGHMSGIIIGYGLTTGVLLPLIASEATLDAFETRSGLKSLPLYCSSQLDRTQGDVLHRTEPPIDSPTSAPLFRASRFVDGCRSVFQSWLRGLGLSESGQTSATSRGATQSRRGIPSNSRLLNNETSPASLQRPSSSSSILLAAPKLPDHGSMSGV